MTRLSRALKRGAPSNIVLTERDKTIIRAIYEYRLLSSDHIRTLTNWQSVRKSNDRLKQLFDNGYLDRPAIQSGMFDYADKRPLVHALGDKGADFLKEEHGLALPSSVRWSEKNRKIRSSEFILHELGISDVLISLQTVCADREDVRYRNFDAVLAQSPAPTHRLDFPLSLPTEFVWLDGERVPLNTVPDGAFALHSPVGEKEAKSFFFLEFDRNTMPAFRKSVRQSSIYKKMVGYADVRDRKIHTKRFGYKNFRVLFVTTSHEHIDTIIDMYHAHVAHLIPGGAFLFATHDDILAHGALGDIWVNAKREPVSILPKIPT